MQSKKRLLTWVGQGKGDQHKEQAIIVQQKLFKLKYWSHTEYLHT